MGIFGRRVFQTRRTSENPNKDFDRVYLQPIEKGAEQCEMRSEKLWDTTDLIFYIKDIGISVDGDGKHWKAWAEKWWDLNCILMSTLNYSLKKNEYQTFQIRKGLVLLKNGIEKLKYFSGFSDIHNSEKNSIFKIFSSTWLGKWKLRVFFGRIINI